MDLCNRYKIHGQSCLLVVGVDQTYTDVMLIRFFEQNGEVSNCIRVADEPNQPNGRVLIQYASERSITRINPDNLGHVPSLNNPAVLWHIRTICEICQEDLGKELAHQYLEELSAVGGSSTSGFVSILQNELRRIQSDASQKTHDTHTTRHSPMLHTEARTDVEHTPRITSGHNRCSFMSEACLPRAHSAVHSPLNLDDSVTNPPSVQRVVVEHVIRNESAQPYISQSKIRTFSGRAPKPNGEVDYEAWRTQVDLLLSDTYVTDSQKVRRILESLVGPAADMVKPLGTTSSPTAYINQLESAFGVVEDGEELFAAFLSSNQNAGEKPSDYLFRLQTLLTRVISRGGVLLEDSNKHLLRQFCRGCWDHTLLIGLQLEQKKSSPSSFPDLLLLLRTEEDRRSAKLDRMKKHLGSSKAAAHAHTVYGLPTCDNSTEVPAERKQQDETQKLVNEIAELRKQVATLSTRNEVNTNFSQPSRNPLETSCMVTNASTSRNDAPRFPRPWFCFKCGEDGHIAARCSNAPNPVLVYQKNAELKRKRETQRAQQADVFSMPLN